MPWVLYHFCKWNLQRSSTSLHRAGRYNGTEGKNQVSPTKAGWRHSKLLSGLSLHTFIYKILQSIQELFIGSSYFCNREVIELLCMFWPFFPDFSNIPMGFLCLPKLVSWQTKTLCSFHQTPPLERFQNVMTQQDKRNSYCSLSHSEIAWQVLTRLLNLI